MHRNFAAVPGLEPKVAALLRVAGDDADAVASLVQLVGEHADELEADLPLLLGQPLPLQDLLDQLPPSPRRAKLQVVFSPGAERAIEAVLGGASATAPLSLEGRRALVTSGPTHEAIDPVRFIGNRSSGKMGYALAAADELAKAGHEAEVIDLRSLRPYDLPTVI